MATAPVPKTAWEGDLPWEFDPPLLRVVRSRLCGFESRLRYVRSRCAAYTASYVRTSLDAMVMGVTGTQPTGRGRRWMDAESG